METVLEQLKWKIEREIGCLGGDRNKSEEMKNWRKAYSDVLRWIEELKYTHQEHIIIAFEEGKTAMETFNDEVPDEDEPIYLMSGDDYYHNTFG